VAGVRAKDEPALESDGLELRWHPVLEEWIVLAPERQSRTFLPPPEACPLCPTADANQFTDVPVANYDIAVLENRFPSFFASAPAPAKARPPFASRRARGVCEVVLYTAQHDATLGSLSEDQIARLIDVWTDRYEELGARPEVEYVFIFENRGPEIGVTLSHPHGQIYAFPFIPPHVGRELAAAARYKREYGRCLHCDIVAAEVKDGRRIISSSDGVVAFVPHFARYPYEVQIVPREHRRSLRDLTAEECQDLAIVLKTVLLKYDDLWGRPMPLMMLMHQQPTDGKRHAGCHLHIEFTPPYRSRDQLKYLAGCETGAGTYIMDARPEDTAQELRWARPRT
jgi:UDPglucose--hexose-1-phosphate uridylyltransferase